MVLASIASAGVERQPHQALLHRGDDELRARAPIGRAGRRLHRNVLAVRRPARRAVIAAVAGDRDGPPAIDRHGQQAFAGLTGGLAAVEDEPAVGREGRVGLVAFAATGRQSMLLLADVIEPNVPTAAGMFLIEDVVAARRPIRLAAILVGRGDVDIAALAHVEERDPTFSPAADLMGFEDQGAPVGGERWLVGHVRGSRRYLLRAATVGAGDPDLVVPAAVG